MRDGGEFRQGLSFALRLGVELVVSTGVGAAMGYALDHFLGTAPWFLALGVLFGGAAGCLTVYRIATREVGVAPLEFPDDEGDGGKHDDDLKH